MKFSGSWGGRAGAVDIVLSKNVLEHDTENSTALSCPVSNTVLSYAIRSIRCLTDKKWNETLVKICKKTCPGDFTFPTFFLAPISDNVILYSLFMKRNRLLNE